MLYSLPGDRVPRVAEDAWVAPGATVVGDPDPAGSDVFIADETGLERISVDGGAVTDEVGAGSAVVGTPRNAWRQLMRGLSIERLIIAAMSVGSAQRALDDVIEYSRGREQFGRPISSFQALRHRIADLATDIEMARAFLYDVADKIDAGLEDHLSRESAMATRLDRADVVVVGLGGAGGVAVEPLAAAGLDVVGLEAGSEPGAQLLAVRGVIDHRRSLGTQRPARRGRRDRSFRRAGAGGAVAAGTPEVPATRTRTTRTRTTRTRTTRATPRRADAAARPRETRRLRRGRCVRSR